MPDVDSEGVVPTNTSTLPCTQGGKKTAQAKSPGPQAPLSGNVAKGKMQRVGSVLGRETEVRGLA